MILILFWGSGTALPTIQMNALQTVAHQNTKPSPTNRISRSPLPLPSCQAGSWSPLAEQHIWQHYCWSATEQQNRRSSRNISLHKSNAAVPVHVTKACRWRRGTPPFILKLNGGSDQPHNPAIVTLNNKALGPNEQRAGWALVLVWKFATTHSCYC